MNLKSKIIPALVALLVTAIVFTAAQSSNKPRQETEASLSENDLANTVERVDQYFVTRWKTKNLEPATPSDDLQILRRLSLALHGTTVSLEDIREFEADLGKDRLNRWTARMLSDTRFADYFAERLARSFVGTDVGPFIVFRRDRFVAWLSDQLKTNRRYDEIVQDMVAGQGIWTGKPATNFITATVNEGDIDENKLAGRSVRAFLGQRIDCAQCHDHPFDDWRQNDFEGLAAYFGGANLSLVGIEDKSNQTYTIEDRETLKKRKIKPAVPFHPEWIPSTGTRREKLAGWITHPENRRFERATVNRVWGLLFGVPYITPVDDLPDPGGEDLLDLLGADFRNHDYDLQRLIEMIVASRPFRLASTHAATSESEFDVLKEEWAVFPLTRLRPEQVIGSMLQAASIKTIDQNSHLIVRLIRFIRENDFVKEYGDLGEDELDERSGTIPQALLRMNGKLLRELTEANPLNASGRIAMFAGNDLHCLETCYLVALTRRPTLAEREHFLPQLTGTKDKQRARIVEDILWSLLNSPEFSWNH